VIQTKGLHKSYGKLAVLRGVDLEVHPGEVFGFVGPNGAGKTTFLKILLGIASADTGSVTVAGIDSRLNPLKVRQQSAYAPGETSLYESQTGVEFLKFALAFHASADLNRGLELMAQFNLPPKQKVREYSHGMRRKLLLSQALACNTPVILLDEPMEGLDPEARRVTSQLLKAEAKSGTTVFYSSHDLAGVERDCDRVAFLRDGQLLECASVVEILERAGRALRLVLRTDLTADDLPDHPGFRWEGAGKHWTLHFEGRLEDALPQLSSLPLLGLRDASAGLDDVFEALYKEEASC